MAIPVSGEPQTLQPQNADLGASTEAQTARMDQQAGDEIGGSLVEGAKIISNNVMLNQMTDFNHEVNEARSSMIVNPSTNNVEAQQQRLKNDADISTQVPILGHDKALLERNLQSSQDTFNSEAARISAANNKRQQYLNFQQNYPSLLKQIHVASASGNDKLAQQNSDALNTHVSSLVNLDILPPSSELRVQQATNSTLQRGKQLFSAGSSTAKDPVGTAYNEGFAFGTQNPNLNPQKASVEFKYNSILNGQNLSDAKKLAAQGVMPTGYLTNPGVSDADYSHILGYYQGAVYAKSHIQTGLSYNQLQLEQQHLNTKKIILTPQEEGIRDALKSVQSQIKTNYFQYYTSTTNAGKEALLDYNHQLIATQESGVLSPEGKQEISQKAEQDFHSSAIAYGQSMGVPAQYIKPFSPNDPSLMQTQQSFMANQDVQPAIDILRNKSRMTPYLSASLTSPTQQETAHLVSMAPQPKGAVLLMKANQNSIMEQEGKVVDSGGKAITDQQLLAELYKKPNTTNYINYIKGLPGGVQRSGAVQKMLVNSMKYCLTSNPNNKASDCANYIESNVVPDKSSYFNGSTYGANYQFLNSEFDTPISSNDAKALVAYVANTTYNQMRTRFKASGKPNVEALINSRQEINPVKVMNAPDGKILVFDQQTGQIMYQTEVSPGLLNTARSYLETTHRKAIEQMMESNKNINTFGLDFLHNLPSNPSKEQAFEKINRMEAQNKAFFTEVL